MNFKSIILSLCFLIILPVGVFGAGAAFLKMDVGARPQALGGAYTALADDVTSIYWNPAGLARINQPEFNFMHNEWFEGINYEFVGVAYPVEDLTFATSVTYLYMDEIKEILRDTQGYGNGRYWETGKLFTAENMALSLAFAQAIEENLFMGVNFKYIYETIEDTSASGFAVDLGILTKPSNKLGLGFVICNVGPKMKFIKDEFALPLTYRAGISYQLGRNFNISFDIKKIKDEKIDFCAGIESWFGEWLALRFSGKTNSDNKLGKFKGLSTGMSAGCGFKLGNSVLVDYAYAPYGDLGDTHKLSISTKFGTKRIPTPKVKPIKVYQPIKSYEGAKPEITKPLKKPEILTVRVKMDNVAIWDGPGSNYQRIATVSKGTELPVLDTSKKWYYKVMLEDGTIGWICSTFVE
ncbi:MAG: PorV/PorQ family protein [bacterium]